MEHEPHHRSELRYTFTMRRITVTLLLLLTVWMSACESGSGAGNPETSTSTLPTPNSILLTETATAPSTVFTSTASVTETPTPSLTPTATTLPLVLAKGPDVIYMGDNTSMRIIWQGNPTDRYQIQLGESGVYSDPVTVVMPDPEQAELNSYTFENLEPGRRYDYRILDGEMATGGSFRSAPAEPSTELNFFVYGDTRSNPDLHDQVAAAINQQFLEDDSNQTIVIHTGDLVNGGDTADSWENEFFDPQYTNIRYLLANMPLVPTNGNHDGSNHFFTDFFPYPYVQDRDRYWSFDYGPAHFIILDQYAYLEEESWEYEWLVNDLQSTDKKWKFVSLHEPGWSAGGGYVDNEVVQNLLQPVFIKYGVAAVFSAHNHYYARAEKDGINHLTLGTGGAPTYTPRSTHKYVVFTYNGLGFERIEISGDHLDGWFVDVDGTTMDHFSMDLKE